MQYKRVRRNCHSVSSFVGSKWLRTFVRYSALGTEPALNWSDRGTRKSIRLNQMCSLFGWHLERLQKASCIRFWAGTAAIYAGCGCLWISSPRLAFWTGVGAVLVGDGFRSHELPLLAPRITTEVGLNDNGRTPGNHSNPGA